jgi:hypothetical protein
VNGDGLRYGPPAHVGDFDESQDPEKLKRAWHDLVLGTIVDQSRSDPGYPGDRAFFDALGSAATPISVPWFAFPQPLRAWYPDDDEKRWEAADTLVPVTNLRKGVIEEVTQGGRTRLVVTEVGEPIELYHRQQDEYCEWHVHKDPGTGAVTRVDFTAENPDYWEELFTHDPELTVALYRRYVSGDVTEDDLRWPHDVVELLDEQTGEAAPYYRKGSYNRLNKWTTTDGVMHLTHPANNLFAEIVLAAQATVQREAPAGTPFDAITLACCAGFGGVRRSSDPNIGFTVNQAVAQGNRVALADPVGLYIAKLDRDAVGRWEVARGSEDDRMILRASFFPDPDVPIGYGGQIADNMLMNLYAIVEQNTGPQPRPQPCVGRCCAYPHRPGVQDHFRANACDRIPWDVYEDEFIPYPRDEAGPGALEAVASAARVHRARWSQPFTRAFTTNYADL